MSLLLALEMSDQSITAESANRLSDIRIQDWIAGCAISLRLQQRGRRQFKSAGPIFLSSEFWWLTPRASFLLRSAASKQKPGVGMEYDMANEQDDISDSELQAICNQVESELAKNGPLSYEELNREIDAMNEQSSATGIGTINARAVIATKTKGEKMSTRKKGNEGAIKANETIKRRGKPPRFDTSTPEDARILKHAYRAASAAISRASKKGLKYDEQWMLNSHNQIIAQNFRCAVTGLEFHLDKHKTKGAGGTHMAPSPDRIDAEKGYVEGNVRWVLWAINRAKGEMPHDLFVEICRAVVKDHKAPG